jgi:hypothetical protein
MHKAIYKFNGGHGALLCNDCRVIVATGHNHDLTKPHYCVTCELDRLFAKPVPTVDEQHV